MSGEQVHTLIVRCFMEIAFLIAIGLVVVLPIAVVAALVLIWWR